MANIDTLDFDQIKKDLAALKKDMSSLLSDAKSVAFDGVDSAYGQLRKRANEPVQQIQDYVREQPLTGILVAFGVGYLMSQMTRHR